MMILSDLQQEWLKRRAFQAAPEEACGFFMNDGHFIEIPNRSKYPYASFEMHNNDLVNKLGVERVPDIVAIWHTHPAGNPNPSANDMNSMYAGEWEWHYIIATKNEVNVWEPGFFTPKHSEYWKAFAK